MQMLGQQTKGIYMTYDTRQQAQDDMELICEIRAAFRGFSHIIASHAARMNAPFDMDDFRGALSNLHGDTLGKAELAIQSAMDAFDAAEYARETASDRADYQKRVL